MTNKLLAIFLILVLVGLTACAAPKGTGEPQTIAAEETSVTEDVDEITEIEEVLDTSSMDDLDQDLAEITW